MSAYFLRVQCVLLILFGLAITNVALSAECTEPPFTHIWLSPFSSNPSFADTPWINSAGTASLYIWARLPEGESISAISLNISSSNAVEFLSASLDNPSLGSREGRPIKRFEHTPSSTPESNAGVTSIEIHGFTLGEREVVGIGLGGESESIDPLYDAAVDAWRIGSLSLTAAATELSLQVGRNGIQGVDANGDVTPEFGVVFGGESDLPLCAVDERLVDSEVPDAKIVSGELNVAELSMYHGSFLQTADATLGISLAPIESHVPWSVSEELRASGQLRIERAGYVDPVSRGAVDRIALAEAGAFTGEFDSVLFGDLQIVGERVVHDEDGLFRSIGYTETTVSLSNYRALVGDLDGDFEVGFSDFLALSANFGTPGSWLEGDVTGDGRVEFADFLALSEAFGTTASAAAVSVPEPSSLLLILFQVPLFARFLRRQASFGTGE